MTAIIGYIAKLNDTSIGVPVADDLDGNSQTKVDKLVKIADRFVLGFTGLEALHWAIDFTISYMDNFSGSKKLVDSIEMLQDLLNDVIPMVFTKWKKAKIFEEITEQLDLESHLIILDTVENTLYFSNLGKLWRIDELNEHEIKFMALDTGSYTFGMVIPESKGFYDHEEYVELDKEKILNHLNSKFENYRKLHPDGVGNVGCIEINIIGEKTHESFSSCFNSFINIIDNMVRRNTSE